MQYKEFGTTGMKVSSLCLGTWGIGGYGWDKNSDETRMAAIREALNQGINFFDTAPAYNAGAAERLLGKVIQETGQRKNVFISTKAGTDLIDGQYVRDASRKKLLQQIDQSLENLRTDYIDLYFLHWPADNVPEQEAVETLEEIRKSGKVRFIGLSNHNKELCIEASKYAHIDALQMQYSMLVQENAETLRWGHEQGMGTMVYGPLGGGILTGRYREPKAFEKMDNRNRFYDFFREPQFSQAMKIVHVLDGIAEKRGVPVSEVTLAWTSAKEFISSMIFGTQKAERVTANCKAADFKLSAEETAAIDRAVEEYHIK